jgi:hypothetical protein
MKYIYLSMMILMLGACGSSENQESTMAVNSNSVETDTAAATESEITETINETIELKEKNQVNDYAEYFLQERVAINRSEIDYAQWSMGHSYNILDVENGYASITGAYEGSFEFAVWRMANGNDLVGKTSSECGPGCNYKFSLYEITKDGDIDVTEALIPMDAIEKQRQKLESKAKAEGRMEEEFGSQLKFILPQKGTSMDVYLSMNSNELEFPIVTLSWDKSKFTISKKFEEIPEVE